MVVHCTAYRVALALAVALMVCGTHACGWGAADQLPGEPVSLPVESAGQSPDHVSTEDLLFLFATIGDSHIWCPEHVMARDHSSGRTLKALGISCPLLRNYIGDINSHRPPVDFAMQLGDLTDKSRPEEFAAARAIFEELRCPLYPVLGNHDNMQGDNKRGWKRFAGMDSTNYAFDRCGFHFIVIDCTADPYSRPYVCCDSTLWAWVARDLAANSDKPTFVVSHYNMWERDWTASFSMKGGYREYKGMPEMRDRLARAGNVVAVINGHVHANRVEVHDGIYYIDVGATLVGRP